MPPSPDVHALVAYCSEMHRVCPRWWDRLWRLLQRHSERVEEPPPKALILGAWWHTSPLEKFMRAREQVEWAERNGCLDEVDRYLPALPERGWYHFGERDLPTQ